MLDRPEAHDFVPGWRSDDQAAAFVRGYEPAHPAFAGSVVAAYREVCATLGTRVRAATAGGSVVEGEAVDLDERGGLVVRTPAGDEVVRFGAVEHLE